MFFTKLNSKEKNSQTNFFLKRKFESQIFQNQILLIEKGCPIPERNSKAKLQSLKRAVSDQICISKAKF